MRGMMGKVLIVDLTTGSMEERPIPEETYRDYLGGVGLAVRLLTDMIPVGADRTAGEQLRLPPEHPHP